MHFNQLMFDPTACKPPKRFCLIAETVANAVRLFLAALMHSYILETLGLMMHGGTSRNNFIPILWAGVRDWETSSAWTRGVVSLAIAVVRLSLLLTQSHSQVLLYAKRYKHVTRTLLLLELAFLWSPS